MTDQELSNQGRFAAEVIDNPAYQNGIASLKKNGDGAIIGLPDDRPRSASAFNSIDQVNR